MKRLVFGFLLFHIFFSCDLKGKNAKHRKMSTIEYSITFSFKNVGYQIFVNDILVDQNLEEGMSNSYNLNEFLSRQEKQHVKIRLLSLNGGNLTKEELAEQQCVIFRNDKFSDALSSFHKFIFKKNHSDAPVFELDTSIIIKDSIPLIGADVLSKAKNLSEIDKELLERKLKEKLESIRVELNKGDFDSFISKLDVRNKVYFASNYYSKEEEKHYMSNAVKMLKEYEARMLPIENYRIVISANGKLCTLERIDKKYIGNGALLAENKEDMILYQNYITFFIPQSEQELKIFSLNIKATTSNTN